MEKPLCVDLAEADAMVAAAAAKNLKWQLANNFRVSPYMAAVKERITTDGLLGSILEVRARGKEDHRAGAEDLIVLGTHLFDLMIYFLGDPQWCMADITHNGLPATPADIREATEPLGPVLGNRIHALYGFEKGIAGHFSSMKSRDGDGGRWGLRICGTRGVVDIANDVVPVVRWLEDPSWRGTTEGRTWKPLPNLPEFTVTDEQRERHQFLAADLLAAIEEDRAPQADLAIARKAQEMIQAAFAAYTTGGRVSLPLAQREHPLRTWKT
jgi:predicted dehydrogenase